METEKRMMLTKHPLPLSERTDLTGPQCMMWRTLVRVTCIDPSMNIVGFAIVGWNANASLFFQLSDVPEALRKQLCSDYRFYAPVNVGVDRDSPKDIYIDIDRYETRGN